MKRVAKVRILQQAVDEAEAAAGWYEMERDGLSAEFAGATLGGTSGANARYTPEDLRVAVPLSSELISSG